MAKKKEHCCQIDCPKDAEWEIWADGVPDTTACTDHVGELLTDAKVHYIYRLIDIAACGACKGSGDETTSGRDHLSGRIVDVERPCSICRGSGKSSK